MASPSFLDLARAFELLQAEAMLELAIASARIGDAWLSFGGLGSFVNKAVGLGLSEAPRAEHLDAIDQFFASRGTEPKVELTAFADDALLRTLADRGYVLAHLENVLARALDEQDTEPPSARVSAEAPRIERVDVNDDAAVRAYVAVAWSGFLAEGAEVPAEHLGPSIAAARAPGADAFVARVGETVAGAAGCQTRGGITTLFGASVRPEFRRRGIQQALIRARLASGRSHGANLAIIVSKPGIPTERNAARLGFRMGYVRLVLVRRAQGLQPSI
jgi:GNAT superfamily N-acetyltransferase